MCNVAHWKDIPRYSTNGRHYLRDREIKCKGEVIYPTQTHPGLTMLSHQPSVKPLNTHTNKCRQHDRFISNWLLLIILFCKNILIWACFPIMPVISQPTGQGCIDERGKFSLTSLGNSIAHSLKDAWDKVKRALISTNKA